MAPMPVKQYTVTGDSAWNAHRLEIQHSGIPFLWANANNKYGPWKDPYVTLHEGAHNGQIVAAAKMGLPGWAKDFRVFMGNPDCTDLNTWATVKCTGKWASEYRFSVDVASGEGELPLKFAWRRTRDKKLGALGNGHRDFKLVAFDPPSQYEDLSSKTSTTTEQCPNVEKHLLDLDIDEKEDSDKCVTKERSTSFSEDNTIPEAVLPSKNERVLAVYIHDPKWKSSPRQAHINFFESVPSEVELWCLTVVMGLQEKISRNKDAFACGSAGYGGGLRPLGSFV